MAGRTVDGAPRRDHPSVPRDRIRALAAHIGHPVVSSVYLNVDGSCRPVRADVTRAFDHLADGLTAQARARDAEVGRAVETDLHLMREWLGSGWGRAETRGLAMFADGRVGWSEVIALPWAVTDTAGLGPRPQVARLLAEEDEHRPCLLALVDRRNLRLVMLGAGTPLELEGLTDLEPRAVDTDVELGSFQHRHEEAARAHYRRAGNRIETALESTRAAYLIVGGPDEALAGLEAHAPRPVHDRIEGRISVPLSASLQSIVESARAIEDSIRCNHETERVGRLEESLGPGQAGAVGLEATLAALNERRLATLLVEKQFTAPGSHCPACGYLSASAWQCPRCGTTPIPLEDVVELAVDVAAAEDVLVEFVHTGALEHHGKIGALLRF